MLKTMTLPAFSFSLTPSMPFTFSAIFTQYICVLFLEGVGVHGQCYSTWSCKDFPGVHNSSLMQMEQCCSSLWGLSWRNASDQTCLSCSYTLLPGQRRCMSICTYTQLFLLLTHKKSAAANCSDFIWRHHTWLSFLSPSSADSQSSPLVRGGLLGSVRVPQSSATCMSWGGAHYRTFDRKHFHFQGTCTYLLASSTDGTWAVYISTVCNGRGDCSKVGNIDGFH